MKTLLIVFSVIFAIGLAWYVVAYVGITLADLYDRFYEKHVPLWGPFPEDAREFFAGGFTMLVMTPLVADLFWTLGFYLLTLTPFVSMESFEPFAFYNLVIILGLVGLNLLKIIISLAKIAWKIFLFLVVLSIGSIVIAGLITYLFL